MPDLLAPDPVVAPKVARPRVWTLAVAFLVAFVVPLFAGAVVGFSVAMSATFESIKAGIDPGIVDPAILSPTVEREIAALTTAPGFTAAFSMVTSASFAGIALLAAHLSPERLVRRLALGPTRWVGARAGAGYAAAMLGALAIGVGTDAVVRLVFGQYSATILATAEVIRAEPMPWFLLLVMAIAAAAPLGEELFFRGYLQTRLVARFGRWAGIVVTSILFGIAHVDPMHAALAGLGALFLGWVAVRTGSIRPAIAGHVFNNAISVAGNRMSAFELEGPVVEVVLLVVSTLVVVGACVVIARVSPRPD
ncbi:MAG: type II CAAX endopeptidase family protein [Myxococcota bacterium]